MRAPVFAGGGPPPRRPCGSLARRELVGQQRRDAGAERRVDAQTNAGATGSSHGVPTRGTGCCRAWWLLLLILLLSLLLLFEPPPDAGSTKGVSAGQRRRLKQNFVANGAGQFAPQIGGDFFAKEHTATTVGSIGRGWLLSSGGGGEKGFVHHRVVVVTVIVIAVVVFRDNLASQNLLFERFDRYLLMQHGVVGGVGRLVIIVIFIKYSGALLSSSRERMVSSVSQRLHRQPQQQGRS